MRRGWKRALVTSAVLVVLLGATYVGVTDPGRVGATDNPATYSPACLGGAAYRPNPDVCAHALGAANETHGEPFLAVHPTDPGIIVIGTISRLTGPPANESEDETDDRPLEERVLDLVVDEPEPEPEPVGEPCAAFGLCLHVTRDGGRNWHQVGFPRPDEYVMVADPTMVFTSDGTLHVAGHRASGGAIIHARTTDLGVTWTHIQYVVEDEGRDRPWLSVNRHDTLLLTWQSSQRPYTLGAAWSNDGRSWTRFDARPDDCVLQSPARAIDDTTWLLTCDRRSIPARQLVRLDTETNRATLLDADLELGWGLTFLSTAPDDRLVITDTSPLRWTGRTIHTRYSDDGGDSWSRPVDLRRLTNLDDDWDWVWLSWADTDAAGNVHALMVGGPDPHCYNQRCVDPLQRQVVWIAVDPVSGDRLGHALLTPHEPAARARDRDHRVNATGDDYHHILPYQDGVLAAWGHDGWTDLTWVAPRPTA